MKLKYAFFWMILTWFSQIIIAQNSSEILCKLLDFESKYPISYATVKFEGAVNGVIADEEGGFRLPIDVASKYKRILISSIGFETLSVEISALSPNKINTIYLKPRIEALDGVVITAKTNSVDKTLTAEAILKKAISKIATNYPLYPHSYIAYYRDYQLVNNNYYNLNEAILENFDAGFNTNKRLFKDNNTALYSYNLNKEFYQDTLLLASIYGKSKSLDSNNTAKLGTDSQNELELLNIHNPIRNYDKSSFSFIYVLRDDFIHNHHFKILRTTYFEDIPLYEIEIVARDNPGSKYKGAGTIYIGKYDYAIHKLEYNVFTSKNSGFENSRNPLNQNLSRKTGDILFEVTIEYKAVGDKMFLNYMTFNNRFIIKEPNPFSVEDFNFNLKDQAFYISFNKPVNKASISRNSNFKLRYKDKKLIFKNAELTDDKTIKIEVVDWSAGQTADISTVTSEDFSFKLKRIEDTFGATLNKESNLIGYQFREFFTQEIFKNKNPPSNLIYMNKTLPLSATKVNNSNVNLSKYWINSPLKQTKNTIN